MSEILRCLIIAKRLVEIRQTQKLLADAEKARALPATQVFIEQVPDLSEAWELVDSGNFDLLFLELGLPGTSGLESLAELRQRAALLPVVVISRTVDSDAAQQVLSSGAADCLFLEQADAHRMALAVRRALEHSHLQVNLRADQERLEWLENSMSEAVWLARSDLHFVDVTRSISPLTGYSVSEFLKFNLLDLLAESSRQGVQKALLARSADPQILEVEHFRKDGSLFWAEVSFSARESRSDGLVLFNGVTRDVTEKHALRDRLEYLSMHDELTGLFNRAYFQEELSRLEFSRLHPISILIAELEDVKVASATIGLQAGDELAKRAAAVLRQAFRSEDLVARISSDEFVVIMPQTHSGPAGRAVQRVVNLMEQENLVTSTLPLNMSLGIATAETGQSLFKTLKAAEPKKFAT